MNKFVPLTLTSILLFSPFISAENELADNKDKDPEDPTKVITKFGVGYSDGQATVSFNLGLDEVRMLTAKINDDGSEWSLGGGWLFDFGILNFNFNRKDYPQGAHNTSYNVGTFVPLSVFDFTPGGWSPFIMAGYSYNDGERVQEQPSLAPLPDKPLLIAISSHAAYVGAFALKPLNEHWTSMAFAGTSQGSSDFSSYWGGAGLSYRINKNHSVNSFIVASDSSIYGSDSNVSVNYRYEWD